MRGEETEKEVPEMQRVAEEVPEERVYALCEAIVHQAYEDYARALRRQAAVFGGSRNPELDEVEDFLRGDLSKRVMGQDPEIIMRRIRRRVAEETGEAPELCRRRMA